MFFLRICYAIRIGEECSSTLFCLSVNKKALIDRRGLVVIIIIISIMFIIIIVTYFDRASEVNNGLNKPTNTEVYAIQTRVKLIAWIPLNNCHLVFCQFIHRSIQLPGLSFFILI